MQFLPDPFDLVLQERWWCDESTEYDPIRDLEDDGQPDEYTEWQDYMGGDDPWQYSDEF